MIDQRIFVLALALMGGCDEPSAPAEPTEPWRAKDTRSTESRDLEARALVCDVKENSQLSFRMPAKEATIQGWASGLGGAFTVRLDALERSRGTVTFDLGSLTIAADGAGKDAERTVEAHNWLGLGSNVPSSERLKLRYARFEVDSLEEPSASRVDARKATSLGGNEVGLRIRATAVGRLVIRNLAVSRRVPVELELRFARAALGERPTAIVARLRASEQVPLLEHGISPRDAAGVALPTGQDLLGRVVGRSALVTGEIALRPRVL